MLIKEINTVLKCKWAFHSFNFIEQEQGWTDNNDTLDLSLFYHDKLHLIQKGNIKLLESIITAAEDRNIGQNTHFNKMSNKKHKQFIKTYKMAAFFKLNHADFPPLLKSTVSSLFLMFLLRFHLQLHQGLFPTELGLFHSTLSLKLVINLFLGSLALSWELSS